MNTTNNSTSEKYFLLTLLLLLFSWMLYNAFISEGFYGGADEISHYQIARYSWLHPRLLLHHWGKPFYTLVASFFAGFGFDGVKLMNVVLGFFTAWFVYGIAKQLQLSNAFISPFLMALSPIYLVMEMTVLTEIIFGFVLSASVYLFFRKNYLASALLISFLPFCRTEGFFLLPFFALALAVNRQYKIIPFLAAGTLFYSVIGGFYHHDFFWLINQNPYRGAEDIYGSGPLLHFINSAKYITGNFLGYFIVIGLLVLLYSISPFSKSEDKRNSLNQLLLILFPFTAYLFLHSHLWWKGEGGSLGLIRVMAAVAPLYALVGLYGFNFIQKIFFPEKWDRWLAYVLCILFLGSEAMKRYPLPYPSNPVQDVIKESALWFKKSVYAENTLYYFDPLIVHFLEKSPYDNKKLIQYYTSEADSGLVKALPVNSIIIWDAHFSANEQRLSLSLLKDRPEFELLRRFEPSVPMTVMGGNNYELYYFRKVQ